MKDGFMKVELSKYINLLFCTLILFAFVSIYLFLSLDGVVNFFEKDIYCCGLKVISNKLFECNNKKQVRSH